MQDTNNVKHLRVHFLCKGASNIVAALQSMIKYIVHCTFIL